jgi:hypothetical protein
MKWSVMFVTSRHTQRSVTFPAGSVPERFLIILHKKVAKKGKSPALARRTHKPNKKTQIVPSLYREKSDYARSSFLLSKRDMGLWVCFFLPHMGGEV